MQRFCSCSGGSVGVQLYVQAQHCLTVLKKNNSREFSNCSWWWSRCDS
jgi:hypothetical protein